MYKRPSFAYSIYYKVRETTKGTTMDINFIEAHGMWLEVGVITDARGDDAEDAAREFASDSLVGEHGALESVQEQDYGYMVRFEAHA